MAHSRAHPYTVVINGEQKSLLVEPDEASSLISHAKNNWAGPSITQYAKEITDTSQNMKNMYEIISAIGPDSYRVEIYRIGYAVKALCGKIVAVLSQCPARGEVVPFVQHLINNEEDEAMQLIKSLSICAQQLSEAAHALSEDFEKLSLELSDSVTKLIGMNRKSNYRDDNLHEALTKLQNVLVTILKTENFCSAVKICSKKMSSPIIDKLILTSVTTKDEDSRSAVYQMDAFKMQVLTYLIDWVAFRVICNEARHCFELVHERLDSVFMQKETFKANVAYNVLSMLTGDIKGDQISLLSLVDGLLKHRIISERERREIMDERSGRTTDERMDMLMGHVKASVKLNGHVFGLFLNILEAEDTIRARHLATKLKQTYNKEL